MKTAPLPDIPVPSSRKVSASARDAAKTLLRTLNNDAREAVRVLLKVVQEQPAAKRPGGAVAAALARGLAAREELKRAEGGSLSAEEVSALLGLSKEAVLKRYRKGRLVGWREEKQNAVRFPVWQFQDGGLLPGLVETLDILNRSSAMDDWGRVLFFLNHRDTLGDRRALDVLREGGIDKVSRAALAYTAV